MVQVGERGLALKVKTRLKEHKDDEEGSWTYVFNNFKLLRVLFLEATESDYCVSCKSPGAIGNLIYLRFLNTIPSSLGNLKCLQTLDLRKELDSCDLRVPNVICKLEHIGDFKEYLDKNLPIITSKHLQFLSIRGLQIDPKLVAHLLSSCANLCELVLRGSMNKLPGYHHFPSSITVIRLNECCLMEDPMPTLEKLRNLMILELDCTSSLGEEMVCSAPHFPKLESLSLRWLTYLEEWKVEEGAMPALRHLEIDRCKKLKMLPDGLRFITTLQELKIG
ncbi:hypothetical protein V6N13_049800 [Hibiscus sabdariffa]